MGSSFEGVAGNSSANASQDISADVSAVDTGMKAGMALAEARNEHAIVSFRYDNMGLPVEERSNEHVIKRTYDKSGQIATLTSSLGANLTYERNEQGEIEENQKDLRTWLFEEESFVPWALFQDGKAYSIVTDHLGTPVEAYNEQGEEEWYRRLDMNGKVIEERSMLYTSYKEYIKIPFLFQGQYYDGEVKLAYNRFRYYDPELGRYISEDPIRFASGATALHSYVEDSNTWTDTFGLRAGNTSFLPSELHPGTISAKNPGGIYRIPASGNYHDDKVALYAKAGLSEPFSPDYIAHHISYDPDTNSMEMQLVRSESHQKLSHRGCVKDYKE
ncbi:RHS repeat domain-containing protein [Porphyromonas miyakawae]|uniref:RHS repeat domain-containing protein n=1 Tax=Porphyromonas miyakawae TaxID=3137470 RepID=UPI00398C67FC